MLLPLVILTALLYSSLVEYCLHRFILHRSYKAEHVKEHHRIFHGLKSYELEKAKTSDILSSFWEILRNVCLYLPPTLLVFIKSRGLGIIFLSVCILYNAWEEVLHLYFHKKTNIFIVKFKVFKTLKEHHRIHHCIYNSNYGIGTSFWDIVFKTKRYS